MLVLRALSAAFVALLSPSKCAACDEPVARAVVFCGACAATVERAPGDAHLADGVIAPLLYGGAVSTVVTRFKYSDRPDLARPLAAIVCGALEAAFGAEGEHGARDPRPSVDVVVPVPLHPTRLAERRFNQSALLAASIARHLGARYAPRALGRERETTAQASLDRAARATNLAGAFVARTPRMIAGARVLLVDDVLTTGATLSACREVLAAAGARSVTSAVVARVAREPLCGV